VSAGLSCPCRATTAWPSTSRIRISTLSTGFLDPRPGGSLASAANSAKPDAGGHRAGRITQGRYACRRPVAGWSCPSALPPPGALAATDERRQLVWLNPSITCSRHLGGIRRRRTRLAAEVQGNTLNLPRADRRPVSAATATEMIPTPPSQARCPARSMTSPS
jgi:hypothetical protein